MLLCHCRPLAIVLCLLSSSLFFFFSLFSSVVDGLLLFNGKVTLKAFGVLNHNKFARLVRCVCIQITFIGRQKSEIVFFRQLVSVFFLPSIQYWFQRNKYNHNNELSERNCDE